MEIDFGNDARLTSLEDVENTEAFSTAPDIYFDEAHTDNRTAFIHILQWIRNGNSARAKEIRVQAVFYYMSGGSKLGNKSQVDLAEEIGVKKATISQKAVEFQDYFAERLGMKETMERVSVAAGMRSSESRKKFSEVCKLNHQKKKSSSASAKSQTRSTANSGKLSDLRAKVLAAEKQLS